jgi:hypothetical protein
MLLGNAADACFFRSRKLDENTAIRLIMPASGHDESFRFAKSWGRGGKQSATPG